MLKKQLLDMIACPICKSSIQLNKTQEQLECKTCQLAYPIKYGFPVMIKEHAIPLNSTVSDN